MNLIKQVETGKPHLKVKPASVSALGQELTTMLADREVFCKVEIRKNRCEVTQ